MYRACWFRLRGGCPALASLSVPRYQGCNICQLATKHGSFVCQTPAWPDTELLPVTHTCRTGNRTIIILGNLRSSCSTLLQPAIHYLQLLKSRTNVSQKLFLNHLFPFSWKDLLVVQMITKKRILDESSVTAFQSWMIMIMQLMNNFSISNNFKYKSVTILPQSEN